MSSPEVTEEFTDSVEFGEPQPEPTIHEQAYWNRDAEQLSAMYEDSRSARFGELDERAQNRLIATMWKQIFVDHQLLKQLALEKPIEAPKPRKRTPKVPKAAMPELNTDIA